MKQNPKKWMIPAALAVLLFALEVYRKHLFGATEAAAVCGILSDGFFLPGVLLGGVGAISWAATFGQFDMLAYSSRQFFGHFIRPLAADLPHSFYEYREEKNKKGRRWLVPTFFVGLICLVLSFVMLGLYYLL